MQLFFPRPISPPIRVADLFSFRECKPSEVMAYVWVGLKMWIWKSSRERGDKVVGGVCRDMRQMLFMIPFQKWKQKNVPKNENVKGG